MSPDAGRDICIGIYDILVKLCKKNQRHPSVYFSVASLLEYFKGNVRQHRDVDTALSFMGTFTWHRDVRWHGTSRCQMTARCQVTSVKSDVNLTRSMSPVFMTVDTQVCSCVLSVDTQVCLCAEPTGDWVATEGGVTRKRARGPPLNHGFKYHCPMGRLLAMGGWFTILAHTYFIIMIPEGYVQSGPFFHMVVAPPPTGFIYLLLFAWSQWSDICDVIWHRSLAIIEIVHMFSRNIVRVPSQDLPQWHSHLFHVFY